jgi:hypothetical protein
LPDAPIPAANGDEYLRLLMIPDPAAALGCLAAGLAIRFIGAHAMREPAECAAFDATRYRRLKNRAVATEAVVGGTPERAVVCSLGALHGKWLDGVQFDCNRYIDRQNVRQGLIARTDLRNDSAVRLPDRAARGSCQ